MCGVARRRPVTAPSDRRPFARLEPEHVSMVRGEASLVWLVAPERVHSVRPQSPASSMMAASRTVVTSRQRQIGEPGALIQADPTGGLEGPDGGDHEVVGADFVDDYLAGLGAAANAAAKRSKTGRKLERPSHWARWRSCRVSRRCEDRLASDRPMPHAFSLEALAVDFRRLRRNCEGRAAR